MYRRHGLTRNTKRRVFDALFQRQHGKCFICGISQAEIEEKHHDHAPVNRTLHIDHCHTTGMIRGLLCGSCNISLGQVENYGFRCKPPDMDEETFVQVCYEAGHWLDQNKDVVLLYMQRERWLPRRDILFHLQSEMKHE